MNKKQFGVQFLPHFENWIARDNQNFETEKEAMQRTAELNGLAEYAARLKEENLKLKSEISSFYKDFSLDPCSECGVTFFRCDMVEINGDKVCAKPECMEAAYTDLREAKQAAKGDDAQYARDRR